MKLHQVLTVASIIATITACESPSRLASQVEGEWAGTPERITDTDLSYVSMTPSYEFTRSQSGKSDKSGGDVKLVAQVDTQIPADGFPTDSLGETPVSINVAAVVTVSGTWRAVDDDDILVKFNTSTTVSSVDSKAVCEYASPFSSTDRAETIELPAAAITAISRQLTSTISDYAADMHELDDVKVKGTFMKCKINRTRHTFTRI